MPQRRIWDGTLGLVTRHRRVMIVGCYMLLVRIGDPYLPAGRPKQMSVGWARAKSTEEQNMNRKRPTLIAAAIIGLIAVPTVATAANGGSWLLGRSNSETATTTVTNTAGVPLSLVAKTGYAPLKVNSSTVVTNLNADKLDGLTGTSFLRSTSKAVDADKVDGLDSTAFAKAALTTGTIAHDGYYDGLGAVCPTGSKFVGGGGYMPGVDDFVWYSGPDWNADTETLIPNSWIVIGNHGVGTSNVTCLRPSGGAIAGAATTVDQLFASEYTEGSYEEPMSLMSVEKGQELSDTAIAKVAKVKELRAGK
jgi:hypothetical protein